MKTTFAILLAVILCVFPVSCSDTGAKKTNEETLRSQETPQQTDIKNWPQFRGNNASGLAKGQDLPLRWDVKTGSNILWKKPIPGLGHSSPVVWEDKIFVTTAVGEGKEAYLKVGRYGESPDNPEDFSGRYPSMCLWPPGFSTEIG